MILLLLLILLPLCGALSLMAFRTKREQTIINILTTSVIFIISVMGFMQVKGGAVLEWNPFSLGVFYPAFRLDALSGLFGLFSAFVWFVASVYMRTYMSHEQRTLSFSVFFLITLSAVQGIFIAGNLVTLLVFFEIMTVTSFFWVIHKQDPNSYKAGYFYLFLGVAAGLFIAAGMVLLNEVGVSLNIGVAAGMPVNPTIFAWAIMLIIAGLGIKAGMVPLHIWLPMAHPVAPTPGSALLSGILIKCGAYGMLRVGQMLDWGLNSALPWIGVVVTVIGSITMLLGVCLALLQGNAKRLLAYHSVSQMGYIILGIGLALFLTEESALGVSGAIFHSMNHALFKSALFLGVGIIMLGTGELDLYRLGGLWRKYPFTFITMLIAAFGITGTPGLNGYLSKTLIHHAATEAAHISLLMVWVERLFLVVGVGTTASFVKLIALTFLGKQKSAVQEGAGEGLFLSVAMGLLAVVMLFIGTQPNLIMENFIIPATHAVGMVSLGHLTHVNFWATGDLLGMVITLFVGTIFCWLGIKSGLFHYHPPAWLSLEAVGRQVLRFSISVGYRIEQVYLTVANKVGTVHKQTYTRAMVLSRRIDHMGGGRLESFNFANMNFDAFVLIALLALMMLFYFGLELGGIA